ncbi:MAG: hypothetical protein QGI24_01065 [Kiritimatiellia bacterium]|jgi:hypothetical protein|nr:hypothetical protein [Kiritimatiellia bacterium]MDP6847351.1 hypothetical protein [Kiritimatiellia bacterium]
MMNKRVRFVLLLLLCVGCGVIAMAFEPLFFIVELEGTCKIRSPKGDKVVDGKRARAYPYGSRITTAAGSELTFYIAEDHEFTVSTNAILTIADHAGNPDWKVVKLDQGSIMIELPDTFGQDGRRITVETASAIAEPVAGGKYDVKVQMDQDLKLSEFHTASGEMKVYDNHLFEIPAITDDGRAVIAISKDKGFVRFRNIKGKLLVDVKNAFDDLGNPMTVQTSPDSMLKMWRTKAGSGDLWAATVFVITPDGNLTNSVSYSVKASN